MKKIKRNILLNPGPATTTDAVKRAMVVPDICPREKEFGMIIRQIQKDLTKIVNGGKEHISVLFAGSGTATMDAVINSVVPPRRKIAIVINGAYGQRMMKIAQVYKIPYVEIDFGTGGKVDLKKVNRILKKDKKIDCLAVVHHETTTGILNPIKQIGELSKRYGCTYIVDAISSYAGIPIDIKKCKIDFLMSTSNKCIQGMAGAAFLICNKKSLEKIRNYPPRSFYLNLYQQYKFFKETGQTPFTPPVQVIYALKEAIKEYFREGGKNRYKRYTENWKTLRKGMLDLGFKLLHEEKDESHLLFTILDPDSRNFSFEMLHDLLYKRGFTIYPGKIGKSKTFRLANIGAINKKDIQNFLKALSQVLKSMNVNLLRHD